MILQLPLEIILSISRHLNFEDKLELKKACRKLNDIVSKAVLYEDFDLLHLKYRKDSDNNEDKTADKIIQKLINSQFEGSLVRTLHLDIEKLSDPIISQLSALFPNVTRIITSANKKQYEFSTAYEYVRKFENMTNPLIKWRNTIDTIISCYDWDELKGDLMGSKYPRLTVLDLRCLESILEECIKINPLPFFTNAPSLTFLTLRETNLNLNILEAVHAGFPLLRSLRLFRPNFRLKKDTILPPSIVPATSVTFLGVFDAKGFNTNGVILEYVLKKYTILKQLVFDVNQDYDYSIKKRGDFKREESFMWEKDEEADERFEKMVSREINRSKSVFPIYSAFESTFFSGLPKSLTTLTLNINNKDNAVKALAESDTNITHLDLLDYNRDSESSLKNPSVLEQFTKLKSLNTLKIALDSSVLAFTSEPISFNVTILYISLYGDSVGVERLLLMFPSLKELYINTTEHYDYCNNPCNIRGQHGNDNMDKDAPRKDYYKLRILHIMKCTTHPEFFDFVKTSLPQLDEFNLEIHSSSPSPSPRTSSRTPTEKINLSNWHLNKCNISVDGQYSSSYINYIVTIEKVSKHFVIGGFDKLLLPPEKQYEQNQRNDEEQMWIEIMFDHIKHFKLCGYGVVRVGNKILIDV